MLNKEYLLKEYQLFKDRAFVAFQKNEFEKSLSIVSYCGLIAWFYPILYHFIDEELEKLLNKIADKIIGNEELRSLDRDKSKVVLYAGQLIDNGALTEQYLHFFVENDYNVLVIVPSDKNVLLGVHTLEYISNTPKAEIYISTKKNLQGKIRDIYNKVNSFDPGLIFLHFIPNDVVGYCVFTKINYAPKYYIVHNDHTFWFGKGCSDFFLEFRKFGYTLAHQRRGIPTEKLLHLPYYPINNNVDFEGFPFIRSGKVVGLSAANLYKYLFDPQLEYFHAIKQLLRRNTDFIFCLCGHGEGSDKIVEIFNDKDVKDRFFFLGKRRDFYNLVGNIDILFESYPMKGGLTFLFAINQNKALVGIGTPNDVSGCLQDVIEINGYQEPLNINDFIEEADLLIKDENFRNQKVERVAGHRFNKYDFNKGLLSILNNNRNNNSKPDCSDTLLLDDNLYLDRSLKLPDSEAIVQKHKLYILNRSIGVLERLHGYFKFCLNKSSPSSVREVARLGFLALTGK